MRESAGPEITPATGLLQESASAVRPGILISYARCSTERQDLTAQREILRGLDVAEDRIYLDHAAATALVPV